MAKLGWGKQLGCHPPQEVHTPGEKVGGGDFQVGGEAEKKKKRPWCRVGSPPSYLQGEKTAKEDLRWGTEEKKIWKEGEDSRNRVKMGKNSGFKVREMFRPSMKTVGGT